MLLSGRQLTKLVSRCQCKLRVAETIQCAAWNICCARPRRRKRATSGSAASAPSSRRCSSVRPPDGRRRSCSTAAAAPARTWNCSARFGRAFGFDLTEIGLRIGREAGRTRLARASVTAAPFPTASFDIVTSFDVLYSLDDADERTAIAEMYRLLKPGGFAIVNVAAMKVLRGDHSVLEPRGPALQPRRPALTALEAAGFAIVRLTYTNATLFPPLAIAAPAAAPPRTAAREASAQHEISVPPAPINAIMTGVVRLESALAALVRRAVRQLAALSGPEADSRRRRQDGQRRRLTRFRHRLAFRTSV